MAMRAAWNMSTSAMMDINKRILRQITVDDAMAADEIYASRNAQIYETALADIMLFAVVYTLISQLVQLIVVNNLSLVNASLPSAR